MTDMKLFGCAIAEYLTAVKGDNSRRLCLTWNRELKKYEVLPKSDIPAKSPKSGAVPSKLLMQLTQAEAKVMDRGQQLGLFK